MVKTYKYKIHQINNDRRYVPYSFTRWSYAESHGFDLNDYDCVYAGSIEAEPCNVLDDLFELFNLRRPDDFKGHSLSVSDVVTIVTNDFKGTYYCDSFGWQLIKTTH